MAIPPPPKRKERKAARYMNELTNRVLADTSLGIRDEARAERFAWALILAALFTEAERELFKQLYEQRATLTDRDREAKIRALCKRQGKTRLCDIINRMFAEDAPGRELIHFIAKVVDEDLWSPIAGEIADRKFRRDHFLWKEGK
jgi:hypothetical protein